MKRINFFFAALCTSALFTTSCSQGTLASRQGNYYSEVHMTSADVDYIERLIKSRFFTPLSPVLNLRSAIRVEGEIQLHSRNSDPRILHDDIFWLNWAETKFPTAMRPQVKNFGPSINETKLPSQR